MENITIKKLTDLIMQQAKEKGFGTTPEEIDTMEKIALIHGEISEAMEAYRHKNMNDKDGFGEELADAVTRIFHLAGIHSIDLEKEILKKLEDNKNRKWEWDEMNESHT